MNVQLFRKSKVWSPAFRRNAAIRVEAGHRGFRLNAGLHTPDSRSIPSAAARQGPLSPISVCAILLAGFLLTAPRLDASAADRPIFLIQVVDGQTSRGVPLVELRTVNGIRFFTDSNGLAAIDDPDLMGRKVFFYIESHGYEFPADGFGFHGKAVEARPGGTAQWKIKRLNIAERLYRVTGEGIYRDTVMAGQRAPIEQPVLNGLVAGQDSVQTIIYRGKLYWFWGDTFRLAYPLGHFGTSGAVSDLPGRGGLDPGVGVNLHYFVDKDGFSRPMCAVPGKGPKWIDGLMLLKDEAGKERLLCHYARMKNLGTTLERGLAAYNDKTDAFEPLVEFPVDSSLHPVGQPFRHTVDGIEYFYFPTAYPILRVQADWKSVLDWKSYEAFTCLAPGSRYDKKNPTLDRDAEGRLIWAWKRGTDPVRYAEERELIKAGKMKDDESWLRTCDVETKKPITIHNGSVCWNDYRKRWIMIAVQNFGETSLLGEVWYAEADSPEGPWPWARKIVTHDRYSFYNPVQHPIFDKDAGRVIYFEGTYATTFSREGDATPRYDYNQIMCRLDLSDPRLSLPEE
ncbi:MAG: hypothetical protein NTW86_20575 [Candidatus Sumerlaeota bacterium]|nr:hypothetical protein [Candidatus Sumerlaeota bacterium]